MRATAALATLLALASLARAVEDRAVDAVPERRAVEQPFLYMIDTRGPAPRQLMGGYALAFSSSPGAIRPVPGNFDAGGFVHTVSLEAGVVPRLRIFANGLFGQSIGHAETGAVAVQAGARVLLTSPTAERFRLMAQVSFLREFGADVGVAGELTGSYDLGRVRLAASAHVEHVFGSGRDPLDLYAVVGVSVRVHRMVRVGAEYVAQDLEAAFDDDGDAEGGARHYLGPDLALALFGGRLLVTSGAAVQAARAPGVLARAALTYVY